MRHAWILVAAAALLPTAGCVVHERHVSSGPGGSVVHDHTFVYFPDWTAYRCTSCDHWWVHESGAWHHHRSRPAHFSASLEVAFVDIHEGGHEPFVKFEEHRRRYPPGWRKDRDNDGDNHPGKGPPPGRGWRK